MTPEQLAAATDAPLSRAQHWLPHLEEAMVEHAINTPARQAMFLAQVAHESGRLQFVKELASGEAYDTGPLAARLGNTPEDDDDGRKYKGRGLIQITGHDNYRICGEALGLPLLNSPELLELPNYAAKSAAWFWESHGLNELADSGDFQRITKRINGGLNGYSDRLKLLAAAQEALV